MQLLRRALRRLCPPPRPLRVRRRLQCRRASSWWCCASPAPAIIAPCAAASRSAAAGRSPACGRTRRRCRRNAAALSARRNAPVRPPSDHTDSSFRESAGPSREDLSARKRAAVPHRTMGDRHMRACPAYPRLAWAVKGVDGRVKPGQDAKALDSTAKRFYLDRLARKRNARASDFTAAPCSGQGQALVPRFSHDLIG